MAATSTAADASTLATGTGISCVIALSNDATTYDNSFPVGGHIRVKCTWSTGPGAGPNQGGNVYQGTMVGQSFQIGNNGYTAMHACNVTAEAVTFGTGFYDRNMECGSTTTLYGASGGIGVAGADEIYLPQGAGYELGVTSGARSWSVVLWSAISASYPALYWQVDPAPPPIAAFCGASVVAYRAASYVGGWHSGDVFPAGELGITAFTAGAALGNQETVSSGDVIVFVTTGLSGTTARVDAMWHGPSFSTAYPPNNSPYQVWSSGTLPTNPQSTAVQMRHNSSSVSVRAGAIVMRCLSIAGATLYKNLEDADVATVSAGDSNSACGQAKLGWPIGYDGATGVSTPKIFAVGELAQFNISYHQPPASGVSSSITGLSYTTVDSSASSSPVADSSVTWTAATFVLWGGATGSLPITYPADVAFTGAAGFVADFHQFRWRCQDSQGWHYGGTWSGPIGQIGVINTSASCMEVGGLGWSPASWVPGLLRSGMCLVATLVVPDGDSLQDAMKQFEALRAQPPLQWVDAGVSYVQSSTFTFGPWSTVGPSPVDVMGIHVDLRSWDNTAAVPSWLVGALLFGLWSGLVFCVWRWF